MNIDEVKIGEKYIYQIPYNKSSVECIAERFDFSYGKDCKRIIFSYIPSFWKDNEKFRTTESFNTIEVERYIF